jgi:hypothetical protein
MYIVNARVNNGSDWLSPGKSAVRIAKEGHVSGGEKFFPGIRHVNKGLYCQWWQHYTSGRSQYYTGIRFSMELTWDHNMLDTFQLISPVATLVAESCWYFHLHKNAVSFLMVKLGLILSVVSI